MHGEGHDAGSENIILQICIPSRPQALQKIKVDVVLGHLIELAPVSVGRGGKEGRCGVPVQKGSDRRLRKKERKKERSDEDYTYMTKEQACQSIGYVCVCVCIDVENKRQRKGSLGEKTR